MKSLKFYMLFIFGFSQYLLLGQLTIQDCYEKAKTNYPLIKQYDLIEKSKEFNLSNAKKAYLPQLDVSLIGGIVEGMPTLTLPGSLPPGSSNNLQLITTFQFNQILWDGGMTKARKSTIEANSELEKANLEVSMYTLKERVNGLYFGVLLMDEQHKQLQLFKSNLTESKKRLQIAFDNGAAFSSDLDEIKAELLYTDQKMMDLFYSKIAYLKMLGVLIGVELDENTKLEKPIILAETKTQEINRPELKLFENQLKLIESSNSLNKSKLFPKVGIMAFGTLISPGIDFGNDKINHILVAGLNVSWSIGALYRNGNNKKIAELNNSKIAVQKESFLFNTSLSSNQTSQEVAKYKYLMEKDEELVFLKGKIKKAYDTKYDNGVCTMNELLLRTNDENAAKQNLILHEIQYLMSIYKLNSITGNL